MADKTAREKWTKKVDYLFATVGSSVGFGNVWRFPYVCYRNGGGVFLIPYLLFVVSIGIPLVFLEVAYGQFMSKGAISAWKLCPLFQGIGFAQCVLCFYSNLYYNVILAWVLYYLFSSFAAVLPWSSCDNDWNSKSCTEQQWHSTNMSGNGTDNVTSDLNRIFRNVSAFPVMDPATEYWERKVLGISEGVEFIGNIKWDLALCLLLAWILVYFCVWKGLRLSGKISYITVISPYFLLLILLVRGLTLPGAGEGVKFFILPDWSKLGVAQVWVEAGIQVFFSYCAGLGVHTSLGSCNSFHHNSLKHDLIFALVNSGTSFLSGFVIFSVLGFMADKYQVSVADVAGSGPGLAFVAYPEAVAQMPVAPVWSCVFFLLLIFLGIDSLFVQVEAFMVMIGDLCPRLFRGSGRKEISAAVVCVVCFFPGLSMVTKGGVYVEQLFEWYCAGRITMLLVVLECLVISYVYGVNRFQRNVEYMLGYRLLPYFKVCWAVVTPLLAGGLFVMDIIWYPELTYKRKTGIYHFPGWAVGVGWAMACTAIVCIPGVMVYRLVTTDGNLVERLRFLIKPDFNTTQTRRDELSVEEPAFDRDTGQIALEKHSLKCLPNRNSLSVSVSNTSNNMDDQIFKFMPSCILTE